MQQRIVVLGNAGSGKSYFTKAIGTILDLRIIHLDDLFWEPSGYDQRRSSDFILASLDQIKAEHQWIAEGVYGELAERLLDRSELFIWIDLDWEVCRSSLFERGSESSKGMDEEHSKLKLQSLVDYASQYWSRSNSCSHSYHLGLFQKFQGQKMRFRSRSDVNAFLVNTHAAEQDSGGNGGQRS